MKAVIAAALIASSTLVSGCLAASVAGATAGVIGDGVELAGKTVYYTGKGAVNLVSSSGSSVPVTIAEDIGDIERGRLRLTVRFRDGRQMYTSERVIPARQLENELDGLSGRDDVVDVYIDRP